MKKIRKKGKNDKKTENKIEEQLKNIERKIEKIKKLEINQREKMTKKIERKLKNN